MIIVNAIESLRNMQKTYRYGLYSSVKIENKRVILSLKIIKSMEET